MKRLSGETINNARFCRNINFQSIAIDTPGGNLNFVRDIKAQTTALNRAIT